jgi:hypothetical protein
MVLQDRGIGHYRDRRIGKELLRVDMATVGWPSEALGEPASGFGQARLE